MADVRLGPTGDDSAPDNRGQLILITGFALAFTLVAIVLLLNTVIYTENIASRGLDRSADEALEYRSGAVEGVGDLLVEMNQDGYNETAFETAVSNLSAMLRGAHIDRGTLAVLDASRLDSTSGHLLRQTNASRSYVNATGAANWTLATDVSQTRRVRLTINSSAGLATATADTAAGAGVLNFSVNSSTATWSVYIYENATAGGIEVATATNGTQPDRRCRVSTSDPVVDLTAGTIAESACSGLEWADGITEQYDLRITNGDAVNGTYSLTVEGETTPVTANFNTGPAADSPQSIDAVYSVSLPLYYETPTLVYDTWIRVAPGEADG